MNVGPKLTSEASKVGKALKHGPREYQANRELTKNVSAALKKANEQGQPFVQAWRLHPNAKHPSWQVGDDGCGCGPID